MFRLYCCGIFFCSFTFFSTQTHAADFTTKTDCEHKAKTVVMLSSTGFDPIPADDCRVIYYKKACEYIKEKVIEKLRTAPKKSHVGIQSEANSLWRDLVSMSTTAPTKVCDSLDQNGQLSDEDFGDLF